MPPCKAKSGINAMSIKSPSLQVFLGEEHSLIEALLERQSDMTPVERFSQVHEEMRSTPQQARHYRELIPSHSPGAGQQYGFEVDLDRCSGCKACVTACHNLNGLDLGETWRAVGMIHNTRGKPIQQTVTTACQHCLEPACSHGCPTLAYEKDPVTGIVRHLDDQCIGCQYCILKCPYDVPQFHPEKGIVRKCDMCIGRLAQGEAPACVQACPTQAIRIALVDVEEVRTTPAAYAAIPGAPDPAYTLPTTRFTTRRIFPEGMQAADEHRVGREKSHLPLVFMLVISQMAAGLYLCLAIAALGGIGWASLSSSQHFQAMGHANALFLVLASIVISTTHLGRPLQAFRAVLGFRRSWLSREIIAFGLWSGLAFVSTAAHFSFLFYPPGNAFISQVASWATSNGMAIALVLSGLLTVHCSAMVYRDTPRALWATRLTSVRFFLSTGLSGTAAFLTLTVFYSLGFAAADSVALATTHFGLELILVALVPVLTIFKLLGEAKVHQHLDNEKFTPLKKAALLLRGELRVHHTLRCVLALLGGILLPLVWLYHGFATGPFQIVFCLGLLSLLIAGECLERFLFFTTCIPPRMPGG